MLSKFLSLAALWNAALDNTGNDLCGLRIWGLHSGVVCSLMSMLSLKCKELLQFLLTGHHFKQQLNYLSNRVHHFAVSKRLQITQTKWFHSMIWDPQRALDKICLTPCPKRCLGLQLRLDVCLFVNTDRRANLAVAVAVLNTDLKLTMLTINAKLRKWLWLRRQ